MVLISKIESILLILLMNYHYWLLEVNLKQSWRLYEVEKAFFCKMDSIFEISTIENP